jgi:trehalose-phosphatase
LRSLWSYWPHVRRTLTGKNAVLLFDFDGTLAPIVADPSQARLPAPTKAALTRLARSSQVTLGIVSGRELVELRRLVGLKNICYVGSHGMEWVLPGGSAHLRATPAQRRRIRHIARELHSLLRGVPGIQVEHKIASVAVHYRRAQPHNAQATCAEVRRLARQNAPRVKLLEGKKVVEILPAGAKSKGAAVKALLARLRPPSQRPLVVYFGDDATDESVFRCLRKNDLGILVGRPRRSQARFYLRSPERLRKFLGRLCRILL